MIRGALAVLGKDLTVEWRTKESLASLFVLGVLLVVTFAVAHDAPPDAAPALAPAVIWVSFVFTGILGIQRGFVLEREHDCLAALLASPIDPAGIYLGKLLANLVLLSVLQAIVVPLTALLLHADLLAAVPGLLVVLLLGNLGFAAPATLFAAIAVRARAREVMLPVLLLPVLVPVLIGGVKATQAVLAGGLDAAHDALAVLLAFDVVFTTAGILLFEQVVRD
ncbi:MAG: heme exporter protein CcmB [bacterium]|nr:heme exporter protein CcmB [bacterium]